MSNSLDQCSLKTCKHSNLRPVFSVSNVLSTFSYKQIVNCLKFGCQETHYVLKQVELVFEESSGNASRALEVSLAVGLNLYGIHYVQQMCSDVLMYCTQVFTGITFLGRGIRGVCNWKSLLGLICLMKVLLLLQQTGAHIFVAIAPCLRHHYVFDVPLALCSYVFICVLLVSFYIAC